MIHPIHQVRSFERVADYTLRVRFEDNTEQVIDFRPVLAGELYGPLCDLQLFDQVRIDPEVHTLVWPNGPISTRPLFTIGPLMNRPSKNWCSAGSQGCGYGDRVSGAKSGSSSHTWR